MRFSNKYGWPQAFVRAVTGDTYSKGEADYTVTGLLAPPRQAQLLKRHDAELTEDVSDRLHVLDGTVAHEILARSGQEERELFEKRLYASVGGKKIGGKPDSLCLVSGLLTDFKRTSVWSYIFGRTEWQAQLSMYAFLARENGFKITSTEIFAMFRDWSESRSLGSKDYPKTSCMRIPVEMWPHEQTREFIKERIALHNTAQGDSDELLAPCTPEERWQKETTYAVMKVGRKTALSVHRGMPEAMNAASFQHGSIVTRPGKSVRCASYCPVSGICSFWRADPANPNNPMFAGVSDGE